MLAIGGLGLEVQGRRGTWWLCGISPHDSASLLTCKDRQHKRQWEDRVGAVHVCAAEVQGCSVGKDQGPRQTMHLRPRDSKMRRDGQVHGKAQTT